MEDKKGRVVEAQWRMKRLVDVIRIGDGGSLFRDTSTGRTLALALSEMEILWMVLSKTKC